MVHQSELAERRQKSAEKDEKNTRASTKEHSKKAQGPHVEVVAIKADSPEVVELVEEIAITPENNDENKS